MRILASRLSRTAVGAAVATAASLTAAAPAAQAASAVVTPPSVLPGMVTVGSPTPHGALLPGGRAETFTVKVVNNTGAPRDFLPYFSTSGQGIIPLTHKSDVKLSVTAIHAPATTFDYAPFDSSGDSGGSLGINGGFYPTGHREGFFVPAHTTYTWRVSVAAGKTWPANDAALRFYLGWYVDQGTGAHEFSFKVGKHHTGGPLKFSFSGAKKLTVGKFEYVNITITNRTGARINTSMRDGLSLLASTGPSANDYVNASTDVQVLENGHWVTVAHSPDYVVTTLPMLPGMANGASHTYHLRIRLNSYGTVKGATTKVLLEDMVTTKNLSWMYGFGKESLNIAGS